MIEESTWTESFYGVDETPINHTPPLTLHSSTSTSTSLTRAQKGLSQSSREPFRVNHVMWQCAHPETQLYMLQDKGYEGPAKQLPDEAGFF